MVGPQDMTTLEASSVACHHSQHPSPLHLCEKDTGKWGDADCCVPQYLRTVSAHGDSPRRFSLGVGSSFLYLLLLTLEKPLNLPVFPHLNKGNMMTLA